MLRTYSEKFRNILVHLALLFEPDHLIQEHMLYLLLHFMNINHSHRGSILCGDHNPNNAVVLN